MLFYYQLIAMGHKKVDSMTYIIAIRPFDSHLLRKTPNWIQCHFYNIEKKQVLLCRSALLLYICNQNKDYG
jgi:hypothetical protein